MLDKYPANRAPTSQLKSQPLRGHTYVYISHPSECWRAPTVSLSFVCEPLLHTMTSLIAKLGLRVNGSISYRGETRWVSFCEQKWVTFYEP